MSSRTCPSCTLDPLLLHHAHVVIENDAWTVKQREIDALRAENERLRETIAEWQEIHGTMTGDVHRACQVEIERLRAALEKIANSGNVHSSWLVGDAREALGRDRLIVGDHPRRDEPTTALDSE